MTHQCWRRIPQRRPLPPGRIPSSALGKETNARDSLRLIDIDRGREGKREGKMEGRKERGRVRWREGRKEGG